MIDGLCIDVLELAMWLLHGNDDLKLDLHEALLFMKENDLGESYHSEIKSVTNSASQQNLVTSQTSGSYCPL